MTQRYIDIQGFPGGAMVENPPVLLGRMESRVMEVVLSEPLPASDDPPHSYRGSDISSGTLVNMEAEEVPFL